ncbi:MAG: hypothetical protein FWG07_01430 [Treponema sp.]|nr:hypothetical protein [Treponema sp.]
MIFTAALRKTLYSAFLFFMLFLSCVSTSLPQDSVIGIPKDFFGMVHAGGTRSPEEYQLLGEMEVTWILSTFYWKNIERERDAFDFSSYDHYVDTARKEGKKIVAVLGYEAPWLYPDGKNKKYISPDHIPLFLRFVEETIRHFRGRVDVWSIWNEPNFVFWKGPKKDFFELSKQTAQKIKEIDPDSYILGGVFLRAPRGFIKNMHKAGSMENLDGLAFHPYATSPLGAMKVHDRFLKTLAEINYSGPVWITEVGYPTGGWYPTRVSMDKLPAYVIKTITGAAARGSRVLLWYELFDTHNEGKVPSKKLDSEKYFGLAYPDFSRKNGAWAYELCARFLPGSRYTPGLPDRENVPSDIVSFCFLEGITGNNTLILWNDNKRIKQVTFYLPVPSILYDISTGRGSPLPVETILDIGKNPLFITWQGTDIPRLSIKKQPN